MQVLRFPLKFLTMAGCWPPVTSSLYKQIMYNAYTSLLILLLFTFMVPQFVDVIMHIKNPDDFTDTLYLMMAMVMACAKMLSLLMNRKNIEILTNALMEKPFRPLESDEIEIRQKFDNIIHLTAAAVVNVACDCLINAMMLHIYCQIELLECRLKKCLRGRVNFGECVYHHDHIYKFAYMINEKFKVIIAFQFTVSMLVVCSNLYQVAKITLSAEYIPLMLYTFCMAFQILIYCWYGNQVKLKSTQLSHEIFGMDWTNVDKKIKESLIMIMNRSLRPIEFSSIHIVTVNLDSFVKLIKTSYSVYSILQHM